MCYDVTIIPIVHLERCRINEINTNTSDQSPFRLMGSTALDWFIQ